MNPGSPSVTAQRVAAYRVGFDRLPASFGDAGADDALARDVAGGVTVEPAEEMGRYLKVRTSFFDRVVVNALKRDVAQVVALGAGYDGRCLRYALPGVRWFEVDHPDTQSDKRVRLERLGIGTPQVTFVAADFGDDGLASSLLEAGYDPDSSSVICCEGVAVYLDRSVLQSLLCEMRAISTIGTRLAISLSVSPTSADQSARRERFRAAVSAVGEPARSDLTPEQAGELFASTRWQAVELSERARNAGLVVAAPVWEPRSIEIGPTEDVAARACATLSQEGEPRLGDKPAVASSSLYPAVREKSSRSCTRRPVRRMALW